MRKSAKIVFGGVGLAFLVLCVFMQRSYRYDQLVCTICGMKRVVDEKRIGIVPYYRRATLQPTAVSLALELIDCQHNWMLYRFGVGWGSVVFGWRGHASGGTPSVMLRKLLIDDHFASDLKSIPNPSAVWGELVTKLEKDRDVDQSLGAWWEEGPYRSPFSVWWKDNEKRVRESSARSKT